MEPSHDQPQRILLFRACRLGGMICSVPAMRALRALHPRARVTLMGLPWAREFVGRFNRYIDDFIEFPGWPGMPERNPPELQRIPFFLASVRERRFDLAIQMQDGGVISNPLLALLGARELAGFYTEGQWRPQGNFIPLPEGQPESWKLLRLMEALGASASSPAFDDTLEFPLTFEDEFSLREILYNHQLEPGQFVCIHPGGRDEACRWPVERFARVASEISGRGLQIVITGSTREKGLAEAIIRESGAACRDLTGATDLGSFAALLKSSRMVICNDTGVFPLAAAVRVPTVVIYPPEEHGAVHPADRNLHHTLSRIGGVTTEDVLQRVSLLLGEPGQKQPLRGPTHLRIAA